ncbi:MAG TPA: carboxypeptidase-like regulatory domain-containing protein [Chitinophagaceae bacterium]|nr:carboxypeptidase-like regulatory domain-containing protein [Chitinophagaceae bacterium]
MKLPKRLLLLAICLPVAFVLKANNGKNEGVVQGQVTDAVTKKPIAGVTVSMTAAKSNQEREVVTDSDGNFKMSKLSSADLVLQFEKKGYKVHKRELINTKEGMVYKVVLDMIPANEEDDEDYAHPLLRMYGGAGQ